MAQAYFLAAQFMAHPENLVVVVPDNAEAERLAADTGFFLGGSADVIYFPQDETLPYEVQSPAPEISAARQIALLRLAEGGGPSILVAAAAGLLQKCPPKNVTLSSVVRLKTGGEADRKKIGDFLVLAGYDHSDPVQAPGAFAFRGGLLDCFPPHESAPLRVEFFGDTVESIRRFNPDSQRTLERVETLLFVPVRQTNYYGADTGLLLERAAAFSKGHSPGVSQLHGRLENRQFFPGMELYLPIFHPDAVTPLDYLPPDASVIICEAGKITDHLELFEKDIRDGYENAKGRGEAYPPPDALYADTAQLKEYLECSPGIRIAEIADEPEGRECATLPSTDAERLHGVFSRFSYDCRERLGKGFAVLFVGRDPDTLVRVAKLMAEEEMGFETVDAKDMGSLVRDFSASDVVRRAAVYACVGGLSAGVVMEYERLAVITEEEVFGRHVASRREKRPRRAAAFLTDFSDVKPGDYVVHRDHGVGLYHGMKAVNAGRSLDEYLEIEYAEDQRLFLPISSIHLLEKHSAAGGPRPPLDRMGGQTWARTREKVKKGILRMAKELLEILARRKTGKPFSFSPDGHFHREFADSFGFTETPDQAFAISEVSADMEADKPMDRLVCGDVGYGKTEVAMRAAFKAAIDGRQTVLLAPTTLLVNQHFANFSGRMLSFGIKVAMLSRFVPPKRQKEILEEVAAGKVDVIIGTHRLLQKDVSFATLGLVIIDEEQCFGVAHKEKLKKMRETVDVLTLTATPIPRTLYMSISGIRDISVINTPPPERLSIKTFIRKFANETISEAIIRELSRGGQIFFVHNSVKSIGRMLAYLKKLVPGVRADAAHGQMSGTELEEVMERFIRHRTDMLVCTTIIESGLDIPNANTIIINRADRFGLAQLYQLRGRVGRSKHRAYAYMLVPGSLTPLARKRIKAMEELSELGSGFKLAARDMEIRGAGNLLGSQQSGHITAVGFETYCRMLEEAVEELRFGVAERKTETALSLDFVGKLEESYIPVLEQRMNFYYRINRADSKDEIVRIGEELADRFGPPPEKAQKLLSAVLIRLAAIRLGLEKVELSGGFLLLTFPPGSKSIPEVASRGATAFSKRIGTLGESTLKMNLSSLPPGQRPSAVSAFLLQCVAEEKPAISPMGMLPV